MADRKRIVAVFMSFISSMISALCVTSEILSVLLLNIKRFNEILLAQGVSKESYHINKVKQKQHRQRKQRSVWKREGRTEQWWINLWQGHLREDEWLKNLRIPRNIFMKLVEELRPYITPDPRSPNRTALSAEKKLALTLYFLKDMGSINMTANTFGVAKSTVSVIVLDVCYAMNMHLGPKYIRLPKTDEEMRELVVNFESRYGFPQAFGCVDGTHIAIQ